MSIYNLGFTKMVDHNNFMMFSLMLEWYDHLF